MARSKESMVRDMFAEIAPTYDLLNALLSLNVHRHWRPVAVAAAELRPGARVLDLATGTGDLALLAAKAVAPSGLVVGADNCAPMLRRGQTKLRGKGEEQVQWSLGRADELPFADDTFDAVTMAFALRNVPDVTVCLREMTRVVRPGGWVVNLELTRPTRRWLQGGYRWYQEVVMPTLGGWVSGRREAYQYLPRSIREFPSPPAIAERMQEAGLEEVSWRSLTCGLATVHRGRKG